MVTYGRKQRKCLFVFGSHVYSLVHFSEVLAVKTHHRPLLLSFSSVSVGSRVCKCDFRCGAVVKRQTTVVANTHINLQITKTIESAFHPSQSGRECGEEAVVAWPVCTEFRLDDFVCLETSLSLLETTPENKIKTTVTKQESSFVSLLPLVWCFAQLCGSVLTVCSFFSFRTT